ncbi:MAG: hypothetical protein U0132_11600 [Gemmatimonadaceae bacterium]
MTNGTIPPSLQPPRGVREIAETLERAGFDTWCVGGAIRDALLGHPHLDWDFATAATPPQVQSLFRKTVPVGIDHGTVGVRDRYGVLHEVTTFRRDVQTDGRHAVVEFGASLEEDLARRDFTINAMAYSPTRHELRDPFGGRDDLAQRILRAVGVPDERMREDRLRALRALRFAGRFGLEIEPATWKAIQTSAPFLTRLSHERVKQELEKTMQQLACPSRSLLLWRSSGALDVLLPDLAEQDDLPLLAPDFVGRPDGTTRRERASLRHLVRLAVCFMGLEPVKAATLLKGLRCANRDVDAISHLAAWRRDLEPQIRESLGANSRPPDAVLRRWASVTGRTDLPLLLRSLAARWAAERVRGTGTISAREVGSLYRRALRVAYRDPVGLSDLAIHGGDLLGMGIAPGPRLGEILRILLDRVLEEPAANTRDRLLGWAAELSAQRLPLV